MDAIAQQRRDSQDLFEQYATRGAKLLFMQIPEPTDVLPDVTKTRVLHLLTYLLKMPAQWETTCPLLLRLAPHMEKMGHRQDWLALLQAGSLVAERQHDDQAMVHLALHIGYLHQLGGEFQNAYGWFKKGVNYSSAMPQKPMLGRLLNYQAYVAKLQQRFTEAAALVQQALQVIAENDPERAHAYFILGTLALDEMAYDRAIEQFERALHIRQQQGDPRRIARCYRGLGTAYFSRGDYQQAIENTEKAIALFTTVDDISEKAVAMMNIGAMYLQLGENHRALLRFRDVEPILRQTSDKVHLAMLYNNIGYGFQQLANWEAALNAYEQSVIYWRAVGDVEGLVNVLDGLGAVHIACGQYAQAKQILDHAFQQLEALTHKGKYAHYHGVLSQRRQELERKLGTVSAPGSP